MGRTLKLFGMAAALMAACGLCCASDKCLVALDVGHTKQSPGAASARGVDEWVFNRALAGRLSGTLRAAGVPVVMINPNGDEIALQDRTRLARESGATLFISVHHDSVQPKYLSKWEWGGKALQFSDQFSGYGLFVSSKNPKFRESYLVAQRIADALLASGLKPSLHHAERIEGESRPLLDSARGIYRFDDLVVLRTADIPAVLIESGVIVNRAEEIDVMTPAYQDKITAAVTAAALPFCGAGLAAAH